MGIGGARVPGADQAVRAVDADMVLVAEHRDGKIDRFERLGISAFPHLGLGVLHAPACISILLPDPRRFVFPAFRDVTSL